MSCTTANHEQYRMLRHPTARIWFAHYVLLTIPRWWQVWEVAAADLSISPRHKAAAGLVDEAKGIALRFPRLIRVRDDKNPENATTSEQVAAMYNNQSVVQ